MRLAYRIAPGMVDEGERTRVTLASGLVDARERCELDEVALWARVAVGTQVASVTAVIGDEMRVVASSGTEPASYPRGTTFCTHAIADPSSLMCVPDAQLDPRFAGNPYVTGQPWLRFYIGVALMTADGVALGTLCALDTRPRAGLLARESQVLTELAAEVMRRLERRRQLPGLRAWDG